MFYNIYQNDNVELFETETAAIADKKRHLCIMHRMPWVKSWMSDDLFCTTVYIGI